ncbi:hypothetical protein LNO89_30620 [Klebsiella pneumoniae subsp. pneumoniae]|nr:hypothetical protein [Klebsiella pneumoniae subsp. pneumoniae]
MNQLQNDLANDPRNLEIRMLSSGSYDQHLDHASYGSGLMSASPSGKRARSIR